MNNNYQDNSPVNPYLNSPKVSTYNNINNLYRSKTPPPPQEKKKLNFKTMRCNTISSLNEVECFLNKLQHTLRYIKLYKLLK